MEHRHLDATTEETVGYIAAGLDTFYLLFAVSLNFVNIFKNYVHVYAFSQSMMLRASHHVAYELILYLFNIKGSSCLLDASWLCHALCWICPCQECQEHYAQEYP